MMGSSPHAMLPLPYGLQGPYLSTGGVKTYVPSGKSHHGDVSQKKEWGPPYECAPYESPQPCQTRGRE